MQVCSFRPPGGEPSCHLVFSPDSAYLLTDSRDRCLSMYMINKDSGTAAQRGSARRAAPDASLVELVSHMRPRIADPPEDVESKRQRLRPALGGKRGAFAATGTLRGALRIWHWQTEQQVADVSGHSRMVNCVSWSPVDPQMLVTASDDHTVRVWTPPPKPPDEQDAGNDDADTGASE